MWEAFLLVLYWTFAVCFGIPAGLLLALLALIVLVIIVVVVIILVVLLVTWIIERLER